MVKVNEAERVLINELMEFKIGSIQIIDNVHLGIILAKEMLNPNRNSKTISDFIEVLENLHAILSAFCIGSDKDESNDGSENLWIRLNSSMCYRDNNNDKPVTEKTIAFALMSFDKEISNQISRLEILNKGSYIHFGYTLKDRLQKIIENYMTV